MAFVLIENFPLFATWDLKWSQEMRPDCLMFAKCHAFYKHFFRDAAKNVHPPLTWSLVSCTLVAQHMWWSKKWSVWQIDAVLGWHLMKAEGEKFYQKPNSLIRTPVLLSEVSGNFITTTYRNADTLWVWIMCLTLLLWTLGAYKLLVLCTIGSLICNGRNYSYEANSCV